MTGSDEVVVARIAPGLQISSRFSNSAVLILRSSAIASTTMSTPAEVVERGGAGEPAEHLVAGGLLELAALDRLVQRLLDGRRGRRRPCRPRVRRTSRRSRPWRTPRRCRWPSCRCRPRRRSGCRGAAAAASSADGVSVVGDHDRAVGRLVGVEAAAGLAAEQARGDHLLEDRGRARAAGRGPACTSCRGSRTPCRGRSGRAAPAGPSGSRSRSASRRRGPRGWRSGPRTSTPRG